MSDRTPYIAGNWKMYKTVAEAEDFIQALLPRVSDADGVDVAICPSFLALGAMIDSARGSRVQVLAQNMHYEAQGAFTGEVSPPMLVEADAHGVILGHSERREYFGETDRALQLKVPAALEAGLLPVLCVGETEDERDRGDTERKLRHQVQEGLQKVATERLGDVVIAYEPIWAIGTGRVATPEQAQEAIAFVRALVGDRSREQAERVRILYGGSVKPDNASELLALPDIDGALVGGASLEAESFAAIVSAAVAGLGHDRAAARARRTAGALRGADHPRRLRDRGAGAGQRRVARVQAGVRRALGAVSAFPDDRLRPRRRPARGSDGQLRGRAPQPRRRRGDHAGPDPD